MCINKSKSTALVSSVLVASAPWFFMFGCAGPQPSTEVAQVKSDVAPTARPQPRSAADRLAEKFPNILLHTQDNEPVRFYDDLVKGKNVMIYFMFTTCQGICPATTANTVKVQDLLGDRFGRDIFFIAVTLTPEIDTPEVLKEYAEQYGTKPGWTFCTGKKDEIELLRRKLGIYDPDPVVDADLYSHAGLLTFGNEPIARWSALPGLLKPEHIVKAMLRIMGS